MKEMLKEFGIGAMWTLFLLLYVVTMITGIQEILVFFQEVAAKGTSYVIISNASLGWISLLILALETLLGYLLLAVNGIFFKKENYAKLVLKVKHLKLYVIIFCIFVVVVSYAFTSQYTVFTQEQIQIASIFRIEEKTISYNEVEEVTVSIQKVWNGNITPVYVLHLKDGKQVEMIKNMISYDKKTYASPYEALLKINSIIEEKKIKKTVDEQYLDTYLNSILPEYQDVIKALFHSES